MVCVCCCVPCVVCVVCCVVRVRACVSAGGSVVPLCLLYLCVMWLFTLCVLCVWLYFEFPCRVCFGCIVGLCVCSVSFVRFVCGVAV